MRSKPRPDPTQPLSLRAFSAKQSHNVPYKQFIVRLLRRPFGTPRNDRLELEPRPEFAYISPIMNVDDIISYAQLVAEERVNLQNIMPILSGAKNLITSASVDYSDSSG